MTPPEKVEAIRAVIQRDLNVRGLGHPYLNLFAYCAGDLNLSAMLLARHPAPVLGVVTGFWIPWEERFETDGPLGAVFLARVLGPMGIKVRLFTDPGAVEIVRVGLQAAGCPGDLVSEITPTPPPDVNFLLALERVGPGHTLDSLRAQPGNDADALERFAAEVPPDHQGRCRTMRGIDVTEQTTSIEKWFGAPGIISTIGIGDGGNEIGMGKLPWSLLRRAILHGRLIACQVRTDQLIVVGVSNWGAYGLAAAIAAWGDRAVPEGAFDPQREETVLGAMVDAGLVDGVSGERTTSVDGLPWPYHADVLRRLGEIVGGK